MFSHCCVALIKAERNFLNICFYNNLHPRPTCPTPLKCHSQVGICWQIFHIFSSDGIIFAYRKIDYESFVILFFLNCHFHKSMGTSPTRARTAEIVERLMAPSIDRLCTLASCCFLQFTFSMGIHLFTCEKVQIYVRK